jgi:hypothetical protein
VYVLGRGGGAVYESLSKKFNITLKTHIKRNTIIKAIAAAAVEVAEE